MPKIKKDKPLNVPEYTETLIEIIKQIRESQTKAILSVNKELLKLYWTIGKIILEKQTTSDWGSNIIETLAKDIQKSFPGMAGFSRSNIFYMRAFYLAYEKVQQAAGQLENIVDDLIKSPEDNPTIGLLLCKTKNNFVAEYALRRINSPIGVAEYGTEIMKKLPKELKSSLPTIEEIEAELISREILLEKKKN